MRGRSWAVALGTAGLLALLAVTSRSSQTIGFPVRPVDVPSLEYPNQSPSMRPPGGVGNSRPDVHTPDLLNVALVLGACLLAVVVAAVVVRFLMRLWHRPPARRPVAGVGGPMLVLADEERQEVADSVADTLARLRSGGGIDDAVIACWATLEAVAGRRGVQRRPAQTAQEFTVDVVGGTGASRADVEELAGLYRAAMFGRRGSDERDRSRAIACLARLEESLRAGGRHA